MINRTPTVAYEIFHEINHFPPGKFWDLNGDSQLHSLPFPIYYPVITLYSTPYNMGSENICLTKRK
jgi:hypothetical protein